MNVRGQTGPGKGERERLSGMERRTVILVTVLVAIVGLVVEDFTNLAQHLENWGRIELSAEWWLWIVRVSSLLVVGLGALWYMKRWQKRRDANGIIYYVQYLAESMTDLHRRSWTTSVDDSLDAHVAVRRWDGKLHHGAVFDMTNAADLLFEVGLTMSGDDIDSGFFLAPNLLNPASIAFGYGLFVWPGTTMREYPDHASNISENVNWPLPTRWWDNPSQFKTQILHNAQGTGAVLVRLALTWTKDDPREDLDLAWASTIYRVIHEDYTNDESQPPGFLLSCDKLGTQGDGNRLRVHPHDMTSACVKVIRQALHAHPDQLVYVSSMLPKSVAVAVGNLLRESLSSRDLSIPGCPQGAPRDHEKGWNGHCPHCGDPWARLVFLYYHAPSKRSLPARVHPSQPELTVMAEQWLSDTESSPPPISALVNLTQHDVVLYQPDGTTSTFPASGQVARVRSRSADGPCLTVQGRPVHLAFVHAQEEVVGLPECQEGIGFIVSRLTAASAIERRDLYFPEDEVRNEQNVVIGCRRLGQFTRRSL